MKNKIIKNLIFVIVLGIVFVLFFGFGKLKTKQQYFKTYDSEKKVVGNISFGIYCNIIKDEAKNDLYRSGVLFDNKKLSFYEGETIYDVMVRLQKEQKITMDAEYNKLYETVYVKGLFDLYEFDYGDMSGWVYTVGENSPQVGCGKTLLKDGDDIKWIYTKDLGQDIK